jgi:hypothetical protein
LRFFFAFFAFAFAGVAVHLEKSPRVSRSSVTPGTAACAPELELDPATCETVKNPSKNSEDCVVPPGAALVSRIRPARASTSVPFGSSRNAVNGTKCDVRGKRTSTTPDTGSSTTV